MNKKITLIIGLVVLLAVGGYFVINQTSGEPVVPSPVLDDEPNPARDNDEYVTHISKEFSFQYPKNWFVEDRSNQEFFPYVALTNYLPEQYIDFPHATGNLFKLEIVKLPNQKSLSLEDWVEDFVKNSESQPIVINTKVSSISGYRAISNLERANGLSDHPAIYIEYSDSVYILNISPFSQEFEKIYQKFLETFEFNN